MSQGWSEILRADRPADVTRAAEILRDGGIVALPTETVYGLAGNALDAASVARIYRAKGRPSDNPLIVHVTGFDALVGLCSQVPDAAQQLASAFWPGPLTMVLPKLPCVPDAVTGGGGTVGVRAPDH
ncbi:MAG: L-threonylcarbamoyladenylate synthase, partial [Cellulomonadaceae bacterium]|nr:L-threonylcarbamoyladenylate synthase [Cellulomonadaceae bacterium]